MQRACNQCSQSFEISDDDLKFYEKVSPVFHENKCLIPPPTFCPDCRLQRRLAWRNERKLYKRNCDICGKDFITVFSPDTEYKVYCNNCWWGDKWSALSYGMEYDFSRNFFDQFCDLMKAVPMPAMSSSSNINCDYTNQSGWNKNCYLIFEAVKNEDCFYSNIINSSKACFDCTFVEACEKCFECVDCHHCYDLSYGQQCLNCQNSAFLFDCQGCQNCFGCVGLRQKKYHIFNKPYSKEAYYEKLKVFDFCNPSHMQKILKTFRDVTLQSPHKYYAGTNNQNVSGDNINDSKNCTYCFDVLHGEDIKYGFILHDTKDAMDYTVWGGNAELIYECHCVGENAQRILFCDSVLKGISDAMYSYSCKGGDHIFGCAGLRKQKYCILNKQYTKDEYNDLVSKIIEHMRSTNEWGEFFPISKSPFAYNETIAQELFPLTEDQIKTVDGQWKAKNMRDYSPSSYKIPIYIDDVKDEILQEVLACETCKKNYKVIAQELAFYRQKGFPIPKKCFECRHLDRLEKRNSRKLWDRKCGKCEKDIKTSYNPERPEKVYCEECYLKEVY